VENFSDVGRSDKSGFKKDNKFLHKKPRHEGEWNQGQGSPTKDKPKQFQGSGFKPKGNFVKKGAPFKGSQPKGDFGAKPKGACFNYNEVGHYSKDCPKSKVPGLQPGQFRDNFGIPTWESREKEPFGCSLSGALQRILYGGRWWLPPSPGRGESCGPKCPWLVPTPKGVPKCELTPVWLVLDADSSLIY